MTSADAYATDAVPGERLGDMLYRNIRDLVVFAADGATSDRIYPHELCERFHASPTPVREALARLAAEGFIEAIPRRGYRLRRPSARQVTELWQMRAGLELMAGELAIERLESGALDERQLDSLDAQLAALRASLRSGDGREHIEQNARFHERIVELSGNELLVATYRGIRMQMMGAWVRRGLDTWRERVRDEAADHAEIVAALRARDAERYRRIARSHVHTSLQGALRDLAAHEARLLNEPTTPGAEP